MDRLSQFFKNIILSSNYFPIIAVATFLGIMLVLFRMKSVEQDYSINQINSDTKDISYLNKDLKARKADKLSVDNLQVLAKRYSLESPKQKQIIVIP